MMKKKQYEKPSVEVLQSSEQQSLLVGSVTVTNASRQSYETGTEQAETEQDGVDIW